MTRTWIVLLVAVFVPAPAAAPGDAEPERHPIRLRYPPGREQDVRLVVTGRLHSGALGLAFEGRIEAGGRLRTLPSGDGDGGARLRLPLTVHVLTLNGAEMPQRAGLAPVVEARLDPQGRWVPGSVRIEGVDGRAGDLLASWAEALLVHLPERPVAVGERWPLPLAGPVRDVPLPDGTTFDLEGSQALAEAGVGPLGTEAELGATWEGDVGALPVRLPASGARTTLDATIEGDGKTGIRGDGSLRSLALSGRARLTLPRPGGGDPIEGRTSFRLSAEFGSPERVVEPSRERDS